jgi:hypothetical protein
MTAVLIALMTNNSGIDRRGGDPSDRTRGWSSFAKAVEDLRRDFETRTGQQVFLIADERDRAAELAFYLSDKRIQAPDHPPVYIPESQDMVNQFSFWPRYDEFEPLPSDQKREPDEIYTEESGVNFFTGRTALFLQLGKRNNLPRAIRGGFERTQPIATIEIRAGQRLLREVQVFACYDYRTMPL